jgi:hypothetical protein
MKRFRIILYIEAVDRTQAIGMSNNIVGSKYCPVPCIAKVQTIRGKRKPKPNPNQLTIDNYIDKRYTDDNKGV